MSIKAFKLLDRPLYDGYTQARKIINSGGGGGKEKPAAGVSLGSFGNEAARFRWGSGRLLLHSIGINFSYSPNFLEVCGQFSLCSPVFFFPEAHSSSMPTLI